MLTGFSSETQIIDAFNHGLIDKFIGKDNPNLCEKLCEYVRELNYQFFFDFSKPLLKNLEADQMTIFQDPLFIHFFQQYCIENNMVEFYLINKQGSFLLINQKNEKSYFIVMSKKNIDYFIEHNSTPHDSIKTNLLHRMQQGELLPFFESDKTCADIPSEALRPYFYPARSLPGRDTYFYAIIKRPRLRVVC